MSFVNSTRAVYVYINDVNVSQYLISGELSDDSVYTDTIIKTTGTITLGGSNDILDFDRSSYPIGSKISVWVQLDNGQVAIHPKGTLYIINSTVSVEEKTLTLEVGCSLAFIADKEEAYKTAISTLFDVFLTQKTKKSFVIDERNLSTLASLLEVEGSVIYQDQYGNIQKVSAFGSDGLGTKIAPSKLTTFDKYTAIAIESIADTAIEPNVASVLVEASVEVSGDGEPIEPLITSVTERTITKPVLYFEIWKSAEGYAWIENNQENAELTSETNPNCGTPYEATPTPDGIGYNFKLECYPALGAYPVAETVTNGSYKSNNGPGGQVDREESWEYCSGATWASAAITNVINGIVETMRGQVEEANGLLQKANQHFDSRDDEPYYKEFVYDCGFFGFNCRLTDAIINPRYVFHDCNGQAFLSKARNYEQSLENYAIATNRFGIEADSYYGVSTFSQTLNYFGEGGEIVKTITREYKNRSSFENNTQATFYLNFTGEGSVSLSIVNVNPDGSKALGIVTNRPIPDGPIDNPKQFDLYIISELIKTYEYGKTVTIEREDFRDFLDPANNYKRTNYSSSGSTNAEEADKLISTVDVNGTQYCNESSETKEITAALQILDLSINTAAEWFGAPQAYQKNATMPVEFAPILPVYDPETQTCAPVLNATGTMARYEKIMARYASILANKISGDNRGFRVTEKLRAEIFEYYPFYPVTISTESLGKAFTARVAASNWVFDSQNAVCSFDCLISGDITPPAFPEPGVKTVYIKTETTKTLTTSNLLIGETTNQIRIVTLPTEGSLLLNGIPVAINDVILVSDITSGGLEFIPSGSGTSIIDFEFLQLDGAGNVIRSDYHVYPPLASEAINIDNYGADGGEFTLNFTNDGLDSDGGNLDSGFSAGGPTYLEAGNFDTGLAVSLPPPTIPIGAPSGNNSANPETEYGIYVKDQAENQITVSSLPTVTGEVVPIYDLFVNFTVQPAIGVSLSYQQIEWIGWIFGTFAFPTSIELDAGTFATPSAALYDFGDFEDPLEPARPSYVS